MFKFIKNLFRKEHNIELGGGLIGIGEKDTDYVLGAGGDALTILKGKNKFNRQPKYEYNQGLQYRTRNYCTIYSAVTELSYLFDREFSLDEIYEIADRMLADGKLDENVGAYLSDAIDYTRRWWDDRFPDKPISSYRISYLDKDMMNELVHGNGRLTQIGYRTSSELFKELQTKGFAMKKNYPKVGGHAVSQYGLNTIDNYKGTAKFNRYSFHYIEDLIKNGVIFEHGYLFLKD